MPPPFPFLSECNVLIWLALNKALWQPYEMTGVFVWENKKLGREDLAMWRSGKHADLDWDQACVAILTTNHKCRVHGGGVVYGRMPRSATQGCCLFALMHHHHLLPHALKQLPRPTQPSHFIPLPRQNLNVHHSFSLNFERKRGCSSSCLWDRRWRAEFFHW